MTKKIYVLAVKRNNQRLYLIAVSFTKSHCDAENILQNVFFKLWKYNSDFESDEHIDKWLTKVCVNESKNYLKLSFKKTPFLMRQRIFILLICPKITMYLMLLCRFQRKIER